MDRFNIFRDVRPKVRTVVGVSEMRIWDSLLSVDEWSELGSVTNEEDWSVVVHPIHVSLVGSELDRETSWISSAIRRATEEHSKEERGRTERQNVRD